MKSTLTVLTVVLVLVWAKPKDEECEVLKKTITLEQLPQVQGRWVLVWGVTFGPRGRALISEATSSHLELKLLDNSTLSYEEKNFYRGHSNNCSVFRMNATVEHAYKYFFHLTSEEVITNFESPGLGAYHDGVIITFLPSCQHCLHMIYTSTLHGDYLLVYRREGHVAPVMQSDLPLYKKQAKCWNFDPDPEFIYDGYSPFCSM